MFPRQRTTQTQPELSERLRSASLGSGVGPIVIAGGGMLPMFGAGGADELRGTPKNRSRK